MKDQHMSKGVFSMISIRQLAEKSGMKYQRLYEIINGKYGELDINEKTLLANTLAENTEGLYKFLGFQQKITRVKGPGHR
jgi:hypothetical protein